MPAALMYRTQTTPQAGAQADSAAGLGYPKLLSPIRHRSAQAQADLTVIRARYALVRARTALVCAARGLTNSFGERIRGRSPKGYGSTTSEALSPQLQVALAPLLAALEVITVRIRQYDAQIEELAEKNYPKVVMLKQVKGVGTLIALRYILTLDRSLLCANAVHNVTVLVHAMQITWMMHADQYFSSEFRKLSQ